MPTHVYQPHRNPPRWGDRLMVHPWDSTVAVIALLFAVLMPLSLIVDGFVPSNSMDKMPVIIVLLASAFLGTSAVLTLIGLNYQGEDVSNGWALERFGWLLAAGGYLTYTISVSWHYPGSVFAWLVPMMLGFGSLVRCLSLLFIERSMRRTIAEVKGRQP